jgi:hypothetical protein
VSDLFDPSDVYLKTLCWINTPKSYPEASAFCQSNGMFLFAITTSAIMTSLKSYATLVFGRNTARSFWINGQQEVENTWFYSNPDSAPVFAGAAPTSAFVSGSNCLSYGNLVGPFAGSNLDCTVSQQFFCEHLNEVAATTAATGAVTTAAAATTTEAATTAAAATTTAAASTTEAPAVTTAAAATTTAATTAAPGATTEAPTTAAAPTAAAETTAPPAATTLEPCGTFIQYDPSTNPTIPETEAFSAGGTYLDGSTPFVGWGQSTTCQNQPKMPGRISTLATYEGPGIFMSCAGYTLGYDGTTVRYLKKHPNLKWVPTTASTIASVPDQLVLLFGVSGTAEYRIARFTVTLGNGTSYTEVSKIQGGYVYYATTRTTEGTLAAYDVLTCDTTATTTTAAVTTTAPE